VLNWGKLPDGELGEVLIKRSIGGTERGNSSCLSEKAEVKGGGGGKEEDERRKSENSRMVKTLDELDETERSIYHSQRAA